MVMSSPFGFPTLPAPGNHGLALCDQLLSGALVDEQTSVCPAARREERSISGTQQLGRGPQVRHSHFRPVHVQKTPSEGMSKFIFSYLLKHHKGLSSFKYLQHEVRHARDIQVCSHSYGAIFLFVLQKSVWNFIRSKQLN